MNFAYTARSRNGEQTSGSIEADFRPDAMRKLERMGLVPISISEAPPPLSSRSPAGTAIASLILGLLGFSLPAVICGHVGLSKIKKSASALSGQGLAVTGLVIGYLGLAVQLFFVGLIALGVFVSAGVENKSEKAIRDAAQTSLNAIATAVQIYEIDVGQYPPDILSLMKNRNRISHWEGPYLNGTSAPLDPWGRPYELRLTDSDSYTIISLGPDGLRGTKDDLVNR